MVLRQLVAVSLAMSGLAHARVPGLSHLQYLTNSYNTLALQQIKINKDKRSASPKKLLHLLDLIGGYL